jgi:hypothetical protein
MLYQFLPRLSDEDYQKLESSITEHGIQVPIILDENGSVIDGHHRKEIADRLGIDYPKRTKTGLSDAQKRTLALTLNIDRRHLTREQKRRLVEESVKADPDLSDREHAKRTGVAHTTVGRIRERGALHHLPEPPVEDLHPASAEPPVEEVAGSEHSGLDPATVNLTTGDITEPTVTEHTVTEKTRVVTGGDGKKYSVKPRAPKPVLSGDAANQQNAVATSQAIGRALETLLGFTYPNWREGVLTDWWPLGQKEVPPSQSDLFVPSQLRHIAQGLIDTATEMEALHVQK